LWGDADKILGWSISNLLQKNEHTGALETSQAQPLIFLMEYTGWHCTKDKLTESPGCMAGHSLGEITALAASEVLSFEDALCLTAQRGEIMQKIATEEPQGMVALIGIDSAKAQQLCEQVSEETHLVLTCANYNSPSQTVISGHRKALERATELIGEHCRPLQVTRAFHSPLMESAASALDEAMSKLIFHPAKIPVVSSVTARPHLASWAVRHLLRRQITEPVHWVETMDYLREKGFTTFLQTSNRTLFQDLDSEWRDNLCWGNLEQWTNGEIYQFDGLFHRGNSLLLTTGILGDCLRKMVADPWPMGSVSGANTEQARNGYITVWNLCNERKIEPTIEEVRLALKTLGMVLTLKKVNPKIIAGQIKCILEKYAVERMFEKYATI
jgi:[acyl-carrier-protein] S-malonyltransferase